MVAPAGIARPIVDRIHGALLKALAAPDVREKLNGQGVEVVGSTPEAFGEWLAAESRRWGAVIRQQKITIE